MLREKKNLLIITDLFPPAGGAGVQYVIKLLKYLKDSNWRPIVLTVNNKNYWIIDESLEKQIDSSCIKVYRSFSLEIPRFDKIKADQSRETLVGINSPVTEIKEEITKCIVKFLDNYLLIPDKRAGWIPFAYIKGNEISKIHKIDLIYSISPPFSSTIIGALLKRRFKCPWIMYFLDPWVDNPYNNVSGFKKLISLRLENHMMENADRVIFCTDKYTNYMRNKYKQHKGKISYIPIGFDHEDFIIKNSHQYELNNKQFTITYTGTFYGHRSPVHFFKALEFILNHYPNLKQHIKVIMAGASKENLGPLIEKFNLKDIIEIKGFVSWEESINLLSHSDLLLLIVGEKDEVFVPGKLYEYLGVRKPILGIGPDGEAKEIVERSKLGEFFSPDETERIANYIVSMCNLKIHGKLEVFPDDLYISQFYFQNCCQKLISIFDATIENRYD